MLMIWQFVFVVVAFIIECVRCAFTNIYIYFTFISHPTATNKQTNKWETTITKNNIYKKPHKICIVKSDASGERKKQQPE